MWLPEVMTSTPALNSDSAVDAVSPIPPATFSPLAVTKSMPRSSRSPGRTCSHATRPGFPIRSPIIRTRTAPLGRGASPFGGLPGRVRPIGPLGPLGPPGESEWGPATDRLLRVLDRARLADDRDLDLARVGQLLLDLPDDVAGEPAGGQVVDLLGPDEDPDLAAGLDGERPLHALEAVGDRLEVLQPLDVRVHRLAAGTRPRRADGVRNLHDRRLQAGVLDLLVMRRNAVHDLRREVVALGDLPTDGGMRTFDLVVDGLADVMEIG